MMSIKRKKDQGFKIGDDIEIKIIGISEGAVKIAIQAPREKMILRTELIEEIENENTQASLDNIEILSGLSGFNKKYPSL